MDKEEVVHVHNGILAMQNSETLLVEAPFMSLDIISEHDVSQKEKDIEYDITYRRYLTTDKNDSIFTEKKLTDLEN